MVRYRELWNRNEFKKWVVVDARGSVEEVATAILAVVEERL